MSGDLPIHQLAKGGILDLKYCLLSEENRPSSLTLSLSAQLPQMRVFDQFESIQGVLSIVEIVVKNLTRWKNKQKAERWFAWVKELATFSKMPFFFKLFMRNQSCFELLFEIVRGLPDSGSDSSKDWEAEEQRAVKYCYLILAEVFRVDTEMSIRRSAVENRFIDRILDRIASISKETKRKWMGDQEL